MTTTFHTAHGIYFTDLPALVGGFSPAPAIGDGWISFFYAIDGIDSVGLAATFGICMCTRSVLI